MSYIKGLNFPKCVKCEENDALSYYNEMWVCGQCLHNYIQWQIKAKQTAFLTE